MNENITNPQYYLQLLDAAEQAQQCGMMEQEAEIQEEMDAVWREMTSAEKQEVDMLLGVQVGIGN